MKKTTCRFMTVLLSFALLISGIGFSGINFAFAGDDTSSDGDVSSRQVFVDSEYVKTHAGDSNTVIAEVSWGPKAPEKVIKGAIHVDTDELESNAKDSDVELWDLRGAENNFVDLMNALATKYGITEDTKLICYGASGTDSAATRLAMAALMLGVSDVKVLDGGFAAWDGETAAAATPASATEFGRSEPAHPEYVLSTDNMLKKVGTPGFKLVSIRSYDEFIGKNSGYAYIDKAGEPEGAIWGRNTDDGSYLDSDGKVVDYDKLVEYIKEYDSEFSAEKDEEIAFYCGTGWRATIPFLIAYQAGKNNMKLWDDGWYVYSGAYADAWNWPSKSEPSKKPVDSYKVQIGDPNKDDVTYTTVGELKPIYNPLRGLSAKEAVVKGCPGTMESNFEIMPPKDGITNSLKFTSSNEAVAKVDAAGKVTIPQGVQDGSEATITATTNATFNSTPDKEGEHKTASYKIVISCISNGDTAIVSGNTYSVLSADAKTAVFTKAANSKSVSVPATVVVNGQTLKVTQIGAKAFTGKKIRKVTVGGNVSKIAKNAFKGSKATKMVVKSKALTKKAVKGSLKGSKIKTVQVKVGSKKVNKKFVKKYKKIFTKKNAGKKAKVK